MYVRVTRASYSGADEDAVERMVHDDLIPALRKLPGFQHYHGGLDRKAQRLLAVSIWDTEDHAQAIGALRGQFEGVGVRFDPPETFELTDEA